MSVHVPVFTPRAMQSYEIIMFFTFCVADNGATESKIYMQA